MRRSSRARARITAFLLILALGGAGAGLPLSAEEGMWMPQQLPEIAEQLKSAGLLLDPASLTRLGEFPMSAIVSVDGCSASFVSARGLVVTNHHCAYGSIQYNSTAQKNLLQEGFLARARHDELPVAPGSRIYVSVEARDVTDRILDAKTAGLTGGKRSAAMEANEKTLIAECERDAGHRCSVSSFYGGAEFQLIKRLEIRDVRLVYAPPEGVGKFGGNADNWMWPRHTGDFAFYRAYVGRDGKPADYSPDNLPYEPQHPLKLAPQGVREGDFVMAAGYPRRTNRYQLPSEVEFAFGWQYPAVIKAAREQLEVIERATQGREAAGLAYTGLVASINNICKNTEGLLAGYENAPFLNDKRRDAGAMKEWVRGDPARAREYGADIAAVEGLLARRDTLAKRNFLLPYTSPRLLAVGGVLFELALQRAQPDDARKPGFQARDWPLIAQDLEAFGKRYDEQVDKALTRHFIAQYLALPALQRNDAFLAALGLNATVGANELDARLERLYAGSRLAAQDSRAAWLQRDVAAFKASDDTFIKAAVAFYADKVRREEEERALDADIQRAYAGYVRALIAYRRSRGQAVYPDANSTLRVTFGHVAGRTPGAVDGTAWAAFTTLNGIVAKHSGQGEFNAPRAQLEAIKARQFGPYLDASLGSVPVNFLAALDISGGNSGSAVLNRRAELVGLVFDSTLDSVISGWSFDSHMTRAIVVDLRYLLWYLKVVDRADELLQELGVEAPGNPPNQ